MFAGHIDVLGGPHEVRGPEVVQACFVFYQNFLRHVLTLFSGADSDLFADIFKQLIHLTRNYPAKNISHVKFLLLNDLIVHYTFFEG